MRVRLVSGKRGIFPVLVVISGGEMVLGVYLRSGTKLGESAGKGRGQVV